MRSNQATISASRRVCLACPTEFAPAAPNQKYCSPKCSTAQQVTRSYKYLDGNLRGYLLLLLARPERLQLKVDDLLAMFEAQKGRCAITGVPMTVIKKLDGVKQHTNVSIDRINSAQGYELGNVQLVCAVVNVMKTTLTMDEFHWWCKRVVNPI